LAFILRRALHAAIFTGDCFTDSIVAPPTVPLGATPNCTSNVDHAPTPVERTAWIWYVTFDAPAARAAAGTNHSAPAQNHSDTGQNHSAPCPNFAALPRRFAIPSPKNPLPSPHRAFAFPRDPFSTSRSL
jgi:hypothetical protein